MNDEDFGSFKLLKLKYRREYQIIQRFCRIGFPQEILSLYLICGKFKSLRKVLLNHAECSQKVGPNNSAILQNCFPPRN